MASPLNRAVAWALARRPVRAYLRYTGARGPMLADSVTYRTLFSIFAGVALGFSFAALWLAGNPDAWDALIAAVNSAVPGLIGAEGEGLIDVSDVQAPAGLTIVGILSTVGLLGAAIGAIGSLRSALRTIAGRMHDDVLIVWVLLRNLVLAILIGVGLVAAAVVTFLATAGVGVVTGILGLPAHDPSADVLIWLVSTLIVFALDTVLVATLFAALSGVKARPRTLWAGAAFGGLGLTVLQQLSGLFVGGASSNPLLASFATLIALLLWINLSSQVILLAGAYIATGVDEDADRVRNRFGARTLAQFQVHEAERTVAAATEALRAARAIEEKERA